jgi:hypothetical protein
MPGFEQLSSGGQRMRQGMDQASGAHLGTLYEYGTPFYPGFTFE